MYAGLTTSNNLIQLNNDCICPGEFVVYQCTVCGSESPSEATVWTGSLFDCRMNEIILRHSSFNSSGSAGECNNGAVIAQSIGVFTESDTNNSFPTRECYYSQLNISTYAYMNNETVMCLLVDEMNITVIDTVTLAFKTGTCVHV